MVRLGLVLDGGFEIFGKIFWGVRKVSENITILHFTITPPWCTVSTETQTIGDTLTSRQERAALIAIITALIFLFLCIHYGEAQQLQRRTPDQLMPISCRDQLRHDREVFREAAKEEVSRETRRDLLSLVDDLGNPKIVEYVCGNKKLTGYVNLMSADAEYRLATSNPHRPLLPPK